MAIRAVAIRAVPKAAEAASLRPPLKWAGGKRWQLDHLEPYWKQHRNRRLVEPFCGGLAVTTGLLPDRALLNDINPHVINFYEWLKRGLKTAIAMENDPRHFYKARVRFNELLEKGCGKTAEAAVLFYYLNRTGFNGLCRFNASGFFNVPFGRYARINYKTNFYEYRSAFSKWTFMCTDFEKMPIEPEDFIYADPPYDVQFTQYSRGGFDWDEQERAAEWLSKHKGPVILSNQATPRIVKLYRALKFDLQFLNAPRRISCTGDRTPAPESRGSKFEIAVSPGNTSTGGVLEAMVLPALSNGGYAYKTQVHIGKRLGVGRHMIDVVARRDDRTILVSMKWQQVSGTAEQKVPYEVICLMEATESGEYSKAYLVLGGDKWSLRDMYISGGLSKFLAHQNRVEILTLEGFVARANSGKL